MFPLHLLDGVSGLVLNDGLALGFDQWFGD